MAFEARSISAIAREISRVWGAKVNFAAAPYLREMLRVYSIDDPDPDLGFPGGARNFVTGFLGNAGSFRGDDAPTEGRAEGAALALDQRGARRSSAEWSAGVSSRTRRRI